MRPDAPTRTPPIESSRLASSRTSNGREAFPTARMIVPPCGSTSAAAATASPDADVLSVHATNRPAARDVASALRTRASGMRESVTCRLGLALSRAVCAMIVDSALTTVRAELSLTAVGVSVYARNEVDVLGVRSITTSAAPSANTPLRRAISSSGRRVIASARRPRCSRQTSCCRRRESAYCPDGNSTPNCSPCC